MTHAHVTGWTDTHCHVQEQMIESGSDETLVRARAAGVTRFVVIGTDVETSSAAIEIAGRHDDVWATVGLHPHDAVNGVDTVRHLVTGPRVVGVGECGLDYHYEHSPREVQMPAFAEQIALAKEHGLTLVVHTRDAWDDTFAVLAAEGAPRRTVFHCFTGGPAEAERCLELGALLSISGIVTYASAGDLRAAVALAPLDRLMVETDSPFLKPSQVRDKGRNRPALVPYVGQKVAAVKDVPVAQVAAATTATARAFFGLPGGAP